MDLGSQNSDTRTPIKSNLSDESSAKNTSRGSSIGDGIGLQDLPNQVAEKIRQGMNILIALSKDPNVDEISAAIALAIILDQQKKHVTAIYSGKTPNALEFLNPEDTFQRDTSSLQDFIIALNKSKADHLTYRLDGDYVKIFITPYKGQINKDDLEYSYGDYNVDLVIAFNVNAGSEIDSALSEYGRIMHDATAINITSGVPGHFADLEWSDPSKSSVCEMVFDLTNVLEVNDLSQEVATALLTGILSATERFSNNRTKPTTMAVASKLMEAGADQQLISSNILKPEPAPDSAPSSTSEPASEPTLEQAAAPVSASIQGSTPEEAPLAKPTQTAAAAEQELEQLVNQNMNSPLTSSEPQNIISPTTPINMPQSVSSASSVMDDLTHATEDIISSQPSSNLVQQPQVEPFQPIQEPQQFQQPIPQTEFSQPQQAPVVQTVQVSQPLQPPQASQSPQVLPLPTVQRPQVTSIPSTQPTQITSAPTSFVQYAQPQQNPLTAPLSQPVYNQATPQGFSPSQPESQPQSAPSIPEPSQPPRLSNTDIFSHTIAEPVTEPEEDMSRLMDEALSEPSPIQNPIGYQSMLNQGNYINQSLNHPLAVGQQPVTNYVPGQNLATLSVPPMPQTTGNVYPNPEYTNTVPEYSPATLPPLPDNPTPDFIQTAPPATSTPIPDFLRPESFLPPAPSPVVLNQSAPPAVSAPQALPVTPQPSVQDPFTLPLPPQDFQIQTTQDVQNQGQLQNQVNYPVQPQGQFAPQARPLNQFQTPSFDGPQPVQNYQPQTQNIPASPTVAPAPISSSTPPDPSAFHIPGSV